MRTVTRHTMLYCDIIAQIPFYYFTKAAIVEKFTCWVSLTYMKGNRVSHISTFVRKKFLKFRVTSKYEPEKATKIYQIHFSGRLRVKFCLFIFVNFLEK